MSAPWTDLSDDELRLRLCARGLAPWQATQAVRRRNNAAWADFIADELDDE